MKRVDKSTLKQFGQVENMNKGKLQEIYKTWVDTPEGIGGVKGLFEVVENLGE